MFAKIDVNGPNAHPLYTWLKQKKPGLIGTRFIKWNFTKFLITAQGMVLRRYAPFRRPEQLQNDIRRILR
jgi:glutathione peroxidase